MKPKYSILAGLFLCCSLLSACDASKGQEPPPSPTVPVTAPAASDTAAGGSVAEVPFLEYVSCQEDEEIEVMDAAQGKLLFQVKRDYKEGEPLFAEEGYSSETSQISVFDLESHSITSTWEIGSAGFCTDAKFIGGRAVFVVLTPVKGEPTRYQIFFGDGSSKEEITAGVCAGMGYDDPRLAVIGDSTFVYSYADPVTYTYGVNLVDPSGQIKPQISNSANSDCIHSTTLASNGTAYCYLGEAEQSKTIYIGSERGIDHQFDLAENERLFDFCFLDNRLFLTMELADGYKKEKVAVVKDFQGNTLMTEPCSAFYRIVSDNVGVIVGINNSYEISAASIQGDTIVFTPIDAPAAHVRFFRLGTGELLLCYDSDTQLGIRQLRCY